MEIWEGFSPLPLKSFEIFVFSELRACEQCFKAVRAPFDDLVTMATMYLWGCVAVLADAR